MAKTPKNFDEVEKKIELNPITGKPIEQYPKWIDSNKTGSKLIVYDEKEEAAHTDEAEEGDKKDGKW